ncbi:MAG: aminotransferase class IV [Alphaproteobacteria bacterium]
MTHAYIGGKFVSRAELKVNPADFGFARGLTMFELVRVYGGVPFHLQDHLARLAQGAQALGIEVPLPLPELEHIVRDIIGRNRFAHSAVKIYLTAGECGNAAWHSYNDCHNFTQHLMVMEDAVKPEDPEAPYGKEAYQRGQRLRIAPFERELPSVKATNYMLGYYAVRRFAGSEWDDILFTHRDGYVTEATRSNFFCVIDGALCTPRRDMLLGITRKVLLQLAVQAGISVRECDLRPDDLRRATEAFTTGSIIELMPACVIDDHHLATTVQGPIYTQLRAAFTSYVRQQCLRDAA